MSREPYDLAVAGGGPGGALLALLAARRGARVVVVERKRFPRDKVCGEVLSAAGCAVLERAGLPPEGLAALPLDSCRVGGRSGNGFRAPLAGAALSRARLDTRLRDEAVAAGVTWIESRTVEHAVFDAGRACGVRLRETAGSSATTIRASRVAAADGRRSRVAAALGAVRSREGRTSPSSRFGLAAHFLDGGALAPGRVELHVFDGGYVGLVRVEDGRVNVCMQLTRSALRACGGDADRVVDERLRGHPGCATLLGQARRAGAWKAVGPLRHGPRVGAAAGVFFVGDAAGTVDPFCGLGIGRALRSAELAAPHLFEERGASRYAADWRRAFLVSGMRNRAFGALLERAPLAGLVLDGVRRLPATAARGLVRLALS